MELECGYSAQDKTIAILSFLAPPYQHWPWPRLLLENLPWVEHCSETLLLPPPFYRHLLITNYYTHIHTYIKICTPLPRSLASVALNCQPDKRVCDQRRNSGCGTGWLLAGAGLFPLLQRSFPVLTLYSPRSIVWGLFFFSSPSSCYAVFFFPCLLAFHY